MSHSSSVSASSGGSQLELEKLLEIFKFLSSPYADSSDEKPMRGSIVDSPDAVFQNITKFCLEHVEFLTSSKSLLNISGENSASSWKLACLILSALFKLKSTMEEVEAEQTEEEKAIDVLSIQSQIYVQKSIELIIGFGVVPYLLPGLGVPPKLRKMNPGVPRFLLDVQATSPYEQFLRLAHSLEILLTCSEHPTLNTLIIQNYSSDILAGLLQVCRSPIKRPLNNQVNDSASGALSIDQYEHVISVREKLSNMMTTVFLVNVSKPVLINSLFLVGSAENLRWISTTCNDMLFKILLSKNGLLVVSTTMIDFSGSCDTWKLMRIISTLMKNSLLKIDSVTARANLHNLAEQCVLMVKQNHSDNEMKDEDECKRNQSIAGEKITPLKYTYGFNAELLNVGLFCGITLMNIDFEIGKSAFWDRLFYHVVHLDKRQNPEKSSSISSKKTKLSLYPSPPEKIQSSIQNVAVSVHHVELLLALLKPMSFSLPLKLLQPVWSLFVQIFVACERYLRKPVQEPNVAAAAEQLHYKLKDVLILLFDIYGSGCGESLMLSNAGCKNNPGAGMPPKTNLSSTTITSEINTLEPVEERGNLCDFILMLLLNQESNGVATLNTFDLRCDEAQDEVQVVQTHQEVVSLSSDYNEVYEKYLDEVCTCLSTEILKNERLKKIWPTLFRQLLSWGTKRRDKSKDFCSLQQRPLKSDELPTRLEGTKVKVSLSECQRFITFKLLGELGDEEKVMEEFGHSESMEETLGFLELLLSKFANEASLDLDEAFDTSQLIVYALGIIGALIEAAAASVAAISTQRDDDSQPPSIIDEEITKLWNDLEVFIPHLRKLSQCTQLNLAKQGVPEMASDLLLRIGMRELHLHIKSVFPLRTRFQQAIDDVSSPMVHVKGHGVLELRRLIEQRDVETLQNEIKVLKIFQECLSNEDSYIYLMSIQGLAALAVKFHKTVIPILIREYDFVNCDNEQGVDESSSSGDTGCIKKHPNMDAEEHMETRMKVGEILVKVVQKLKEFAPSYRVPLTNVFFRLMRDDEPLIRASALSNLGELCHFLKFSLRVILTEVWYCVESILSTDKDISVRRAALHLLVMLLKGVQNELSVEDILSDSSVSQHLRDARRLLTRVEETEVDLVAKTHCQLALQELELIVKKLLTPNTSLTYKIQILDL